MDIHEGSEKQKDKRITKPEQRRKSKLGEASYAVLIQ